MSVDAELAGRMFRARHHREGESGRKLVLREISADVSSTLGREEPYDPSVVARWLKAEQEPKTRAQWIALARALDVDVGWLAFGPDSAAPAPSTVTGSSSRAKAVDKPMRSAGEIERMPETQRPAVTKKAANGGRKERR